MSDHATKTLGEVTQEARELARRGKTLDQIVDIIGDDVVQPAHQAPGDVALEHIQSKEIVDLTFAMDQS